MWRRALFSLLSSASLVACVGICLLWPRSYWYFDMVGRQAYSGVGTEVISMSGRVIFYHFNGYTDEPPPQVWGRNSAKLSSPVGTRLAREFDVSGGPHRYNRAGFRWISGQAFGPGTVMEVVSMPHWFLVTVTAPLAAVAAVRLRREFRREKKEVKERK